MGHWWPKKSLRWHANIEWGTCTIDMWDDFKREIERQFYLENVEYLARKKLKRLRHMGSIRDYVKEFSTLMLEIPDLAEKDLFFNFMDGLLPWDEQELQRHGVQDLASAMALAEQLVELRRNGPSRQRPYMNDYDNGGGDQEERSSTQEEGVVSP
ncbi:hypothetical protein AMTR_s00007p00021120 [Amborella trichopoda]|uniref:Retrotransposon gag domain-containing protein n=1 Tax=Amborella trichopoda TaxID=13333 RepID=W1PB89_AMBTC|nr:hypothetical protein AMTR_s00007p00021120 [Amborella trichopoda]